MPVRFITDAAPSSENDRIAEFDSVQHGALSFSRILQPVGDISFLRLGYLRALKQNRDHLCRELGRGRRVVHCLRAFPEGITALGSSVGFGRRPRIVTYAHGEEILVARSSRQLNILARAVYRASDLVIANSVNTQAMVRELASSANVVVIHPGVDAACYKVSPEGRRAARAQLRLPEKSIVICTVSRMEPRKNQRAVIESLPGLREGGRDYRYICAGDGVDRPALTALVERLGVSAYVTFPGRVSELEKRRIFSASDIHVMPSIQVGQMVEGFGIVFLEASASGIPSIAGDSGGQREAVIDGRTGRIVDGRDVAALSSAIRELGDDPGKRHAFGAAAEAFARDFDWSKVLKTTMDVVDRTIG